MESVELVAPGRRWLLVTGATGTVGGFVLELARMRGIRTVAAGRPHNAGSLAADHVFTGTGGLGRTVRAAVPGGVDAVIDTANLAIAAHDALRARGTFVALVRPFAPPPLRGTLVVIAEVYADGGQLAELAALVDAGRLTPQVARTFPLAEAAAAYELFERGGNRGRIVLTT